MDAILDFSRDFNVQLFDQVVNTFYGGHGNDQKMAQTIIAQFQEHPDAWTRADVILTQAQSVQAKYIGLQVLEKLISTRWKVLPREQCTGIRDFIVGTIIKIASDEQLFVKERVYLNKLNLVLVQILKHEWPKQWPNFISEIVDSSRTSLTLCENNMVILKLLSEEIFDFSAEQMTSVKARTMKDQLNGEFMKIFELCDEVLQKAQKPSLIQATLQTLLRFLNWIPLAFVFETNLISMLVGRFLQVAAFRNYTLKCLTEIGCLEVKSDYEQRLIELYNGVVEALSIQIPMNPHLDFAGPYENGSDEEQEFIQNIALFFSSFLSVHVKLLERQDNKQPLLLGHLYLLKISKVEDREVFKVCLEYWSKLVSGLYNELPSSLNNASGLVLNSKQPERKLLYSDILPQLRVVMIESMVRPEEVLIVENDEGEIVREFVKETDTITLYKSMREVLVYLTHLDPDNTEQIMSEKLAKQIYRTEWSWSNLNKLCWAIGSISGAMSEDHEKRFIVFVIKDLLGHTESVRGKDNKAVVASNIMYIVGQYPRFLRSHWKFLKTVVLKLFEFMHELHEGVQDMACDTYIKIAQKCKRQFVIMQPNEIQPFINEILDTIPDIISDLQPSQVHTFYDATGCIIASQTNRQTQEQLIAKLMEGPNVAWEEVMAQANANPDILNHPDQVKQLANILKTNVAACSSIGSPFISQMAKIYMDMLNLYRAVSELISRAVAQGGVLQTKTPQVRGYRTIKKEVLKLISTYIQKAEDLQVVMDNLIPPLLEAVLTDYARNVEPARESEVLALMATCVQKLGPLMTDKVPVLLESLFESTLHMIDKDFQEYPEHRVAFYNMIRAINQNCFIALLNLPPNLFRLVLNAIIWGFRHTMRDIADMGLQIMLELLNNVSKLDSSISSAFYRSYYLPIFQDVFYVLTDREHKSGFKYQAQILQQLCTVVDSNSITQPLYQPGQVSDPNTSNSAFVREYMMQLLQNAFPNLQPGQIKIFVNGLFDLKGDSETFKQHLRDFLVKLKEFQAADDNEELFLEERELELQKKKAAEMQAAQQVSGILKPAEREDMDD
ncbi:hypothetical protein MP228_012657 [Amoeboaphelidium protococcarum]|nr:hypothetical protein MP228_012657 [Amoeboaphelidium protococcarum]